MPSKTSQCKVSTFNEGSYVLALRQRTAGSPCLLAVLVPINLPPGGFPLPWFLIFLFLFSPRPINILSANISLRRAFSCRILSLIYQIKKDILIPSFHHASCTSNVGIRNEKSQTRVLFRVIPQITIYLYSFWSPEVYKFWHRLLVPKLVQIPLQPRKS